MNLGLWAAQTQDLYTLITIVFATIAVAVILSLYFRTQLGLAMRAAGDNIDMIRALRS
ncbi:MAG: hypothetical protein U0936_11535 [Planctomycetaceae bacterium]